MHDLYINANIRSFALPSSSLTLDTSNLQQIRQFPSQTSQPRRATSITLLMPPSKDGIPESKVPNFLGEKIPSVSRTTIVSSFKRCPISRFSRITIFAQMASVGFFFPWQIFVSFWEQSTVPFYAHSKRPMGHFGEFWASNLRGSQRGQ